MTALVEVDGAEPLKEGACRIIAEAGANHNNSISRAIDLATRAAEAGAWAVKYQLYKAETLAVRSSPKYWNDEIGTATQFEAFKKSDQLGYAEYHEVAHACRDLGLVFFATPFDFAAVDALESMGVGLYKVASGDITHRPLLELLAETGKPIILSTGACTLDEIQQAVDWLGCGPDRLVLQVCTLTYPTPDSDANFARISTFRSRFAPYLIGMSDHTLGVEGAWMAAALGAVCVEKHYTLDKSLPDVPDHAMSVDPAELAAMVRAADRAATLRGSSEIRVVASEQPARTNARRSLVLRRSMEEGELIERNDLDYKRPGTGLSPADIDSVAGRRTRRALPADVPLKPDDLA